MPANPTYQVERDQFEQRIMLESPVSAEAFNQAEAWIGAQPFQVQTKLPWYVKRYWQKQNKKAGCLHPA